MIGALLAIAAVLYSLTAGARLVLHVSGAVPADPAQYPELHDLVDALAIGDGIPKPAVYIIDDPSPNAFSTGVSSNKAAIAFTTGLLAIMDREELEGVISHEMSHIKNHDIRLLLVVSTMIGMAALLASLLWRGAFWGSIGNDNDGGNQALIVIVAAGALLAVVGFLFGPLIRFALSRRRESLADVSGVELTPKPGRIAKCTEEAATRTTSHVQEDEPCYGCDVHRRSIAAPRGLGTTASTTPTLPSRRGSLTWNGPPRANRSDQPFLLGAPVRPKRPSLGPAVWPARPNRVFFG